LAGRQGTPAARPGHPGIRAAGRRRQGDRRAVPVGGRRGSPGEARPAAAAAPREGRQGSPGEARPAAAAAPREGRRGSQAAGRQVAVLRDNRVALRQDSPVAVEDERS
jgi:hypothetical protein